MPNSKHEDAFLKMGVEYFREHILKLLGINYSYEEIGPTELVALTINELYMDFTSRLLRKICISILSSRLQTILRRKISDVFIPMMRYFRITWMRM